MKIIIQNSVEGTCVPEDMFPDGQEAVELGYISYTNPHARDPRVPYVLRIEGAVGADLWTAIFTHVELCLRFTRMHPSFQIRFLEKIVDMIQDKNLDVLKIEIPWNTQKRFLTAEVRGNEIRLGLTKEQ